MPSVPAIVEQDALVETQVRFVMHWVKRNHRLRYQNISELDGLLRTVRTFLYMIQVFNLLC